MYRYKCKFLYMLYYTNFLIIQRNIEICDDNLDRFILSTEQTHAQISPININISDKVHYILTRYILSEQQEPAGNRVQDLTWVVLHAYIQVPVHKLLNHTMCRLPIPVHNPALPTFNTRASKALRRRVPPIHSHVD